jgi:hypothetical protein
VEINDETTGTELVDAPHPPATPGLGRLGATPSRVLRSALGHCPIVSGTPVAGGYRGGT